MTTAAPDPPCGLAGDIAALRGALPSTMQACSGLARAAPTPGALDGRSREWIAIGIVSAGHCERRTGFHSEAALAAGARRGTGPHAGFRSAHRTGVH